jgi:hypothetical protein
MYNIRFVNHPKKIPRERTKESGRSFKPCLTPFTILTDLERKHSLHIKEHDLNTD